MNAIRISVILIALLAPNILWSQQREKEELPSFASYEVTETFQGAKARLLLQPHEGFKKRLKEVYSRPPNFAGHYVLGDWGCGAACRFVAIIDAQTGRIIDGIRISDWASSESFPCSIGNPMEFRLNSRLLIVYGSLDEKRKGIYYFAMEPKGLKRIEAIEGIEEIKEYKGCHHP